MSDEVPIFEGCVDKLPSLKPGERLVCHAANLLGNTQDHAYLGSASIEKG